MATIDEVLVVLNQVLDAMATRPDGGDWGVPADYSVLVRQDQPPASGASQFKVEDVALAANTWLCRHDADIEAKELDDIVSYGAAQPGDPITGAIWYDTGASVLKQYDGAAWQSVGGGVAAHAILDGTVHSDSVADGVTKGSIIVGNATPKWDELVVGTDGHVLTSQADGTVAWEAAAGGASQLSDLSDVGVTTPTDGNVLRADGDSWESAALDHADLGSVTSDQHHAQSHTVASHSDTTGTGAELNTLTSAGNADALHVHAAAGITLAHSDLGSVTSDQHHAQSHTVASHSDTTGTGAELNTLTDGSDAGALHLHDARYYTEGEVDGLLHGEAHTITSHSDVVDATGAQLETLTGGGDVGALHIHDARYYTEGEVDGLLHTRSHAVTSTSDHTAGNWKTLYSNGSGQVIELALGAATKVLTAGGAAAAPTWETLVQGSITDLPLTATNGGTGLDLHLASAGEMIAGVGDGTIGLGSAANTVWFGTGAAIAQTLNFNSGDVGSVIYNSASGYFELSSGALLNGNLEFAAAATIITTAGTDGNISITPDDVGDLVLDGLKWPQADGTIGELLTTNGAGQLSWTAAGAGDVTAAAALTENYIVLGDAAAKAVKAGSVDNVYFGSGTANPILNFMGNAASNGTIQWYAAGAAWIFSNNVAVATSLTTPLAYGSTAAAGVLTLAGSSHGTPAQDAVNINVEGSCFASFKDHSASNRTMMLLGSDTLPTNIGDAMFTATRDGTWNSFRIAAHSATAAHHPTLSFARSYGTGASPTDVGDGANIGSLAFKPYGNSAAYYTRAQILAVTSGVPSGTTIPVDLLVSVGSTGVSEVCRFMSDQNMRMAGTNEIQFDTSGASIWGSGGVLTLKFGSQINFDAGASTELVLSANTLRFESGANDISFDWFTGGHLKMKYNAIERFSLGATGVSFHGASDVAQSAGWDITNWTSDKGFDCLDAAADVDHECRQVVATLISYLIERGDLAGTVTGP